MKKIAYLWEKYGPPRLIEIFDGREDLSKKPAIPEASGTVQRLKDASDKRHEKRGNILARWKRKL